MKIDFAFICDAADISGGKLSALGIGIDAIMSPKLPTVIPQLYVVAQLRGSIAEVGEKRACIRIIDADGADLIEPQNMTISCIEVKGKLRAKSQIMWRFYGLVFEQYSDYTVHLTIEGLELASIPFAVMAPPDNHG